MNLLRAMKIAVLSVLVLAASSAYSQESTINFEKNVNKKVVKGWVDSLYKISGISSTTYITKKSGGKDSLHKLKHRDVIIWIPKATDLSKKTTVVFWFHGHYGYVPYRTFQDRTLKQFVPLAGKKNFMLVIPEMPWSIHTSTPTKRNSRLWLKSGDFIKFVDQIKNIMVKHNSGKELGEVDYRVVGHSAGGSTIKRLSMTGDLCKLKPSMVVWSDSSYGPWLDVAWDSCLEKDPSILVKVLVVKGGSPWRNAVRFMGQFQDPPANLQLYIMKTPRWSHKLIGNNAVKLSKLLGD